MAKIIKIILIPSFVVAFIIAAVVQSAKFRNKNKKT